MTQKIPFATNVETGEIVSLDLDYAIEERISIQANSGGGKSWLVRCLAEQTHGQVQQIIISPKKEFVSLREKFDYIHVGTATQVSKPDIELNVRYAEQLAIKILESGIDAIIEFSEFSKERVKYVRYFLEAIVNAPEHLWHPVMIVIDEIDIWAPEKGHGEAESLGVIADLASRGRDKGFFLVAATQKLAKFNKDVASELNIKFIGKCSLDIDQSRACQELGIPLKDKGRLRELGRPNFHFYAFGSGLSDDVIKIKAFPVKTTHVSGYKRNKSQKPIPTPEKIKQILQAFDSLPKEAEKEIHTKEDMMKKIREQDITIKTLKRQAPKVDPEHIKKVEQANYSKGYNDAKRDIESIYKSKLVHIHELTKKRVHVTEKLFETLAQFGVSKSMIQAVDEKISIELNTQPLYPPTPSQVIIAPIPIKTTTIPSSYSPSREMSKLVSVTRTTQMEDQVLGSGTLTPLERKILTAVLQRGETGGTRIIIATMVGYAPKTKVFTNSLYHLRSMGMIEYSGDAVIATDLGAQTIPIVEPLPIIPVELLEYWASKLSGIEGKLLRVVFENRDGITREELASQVNYAPKTKAFTNSLYHIRSIGLVEYSGEKVVPTKELYP